MFKTLKNRMIMNQINSLNGNMFTLHGHYDGVFRGVLPINYEKIELPEGIKSKIHLYSDDGTLQVFFLNENGEKIAVVECLKTEEMLERSSKLKAERKKKRLEEEKKALEARLKAEELRIKTLEKMEKRKEISVQNRYDGYVDFLIKHGANKDLIELPAVNNLILNLIENGDPRLVAEGHSPIAYEMPHEDGTFDIAGRINGPFIDKKYKMSYSDSEDYYLAITCFEKYDSSFIDRGVVYINKSGEIANIDKKPPVRTR